MSPHSCGMAAIPVRPENHGTRAAGAYGDGPCLLPPCLLSLCQLHPSAAVSRLLSPGCYLPAAISRLLSPGCYLPAAISRLLSPGCYLPAAVSRLLSPGCYLPAAVSRLLSPGCCLPAAISRLLSPGCCLPAAVFRPPCCRANAACPPCQWVALYQPVFWMLFTTIPLVLGALVEMPE